MNKKPIYIGLGLALVSLASCTVTTPLYEGGTYDSGDFTKNYFHNHDEIGDKEGSLVTSVTLTSGEYFNGFRENDATQWEGTGMKTMYPDLFTYETADGNKISYSSLDSVASAIDTGNDYDSFGKDHSLIKVDDAFRSGVLSKLYNGQLECHSWYAVARVQCDSDGFKAYFPKTMTDGEIFMVSLRGNTDESGSYNPVASADVRVRFYLDGDTHDYCEIVYDDAHMPVNSGGSSITLLGSSLKDAFGTAYAERGVVGYSISFENPVYEDGKDVSFDADDLDHDVHFGFSLYELSILHSTWR